MLCFYLFLLFLACMIVVIDGVDALFVLVLAGTNSGSGYYGDNGPANRSMLTAPRGLYRDSLGNLLICDSSNHVIRKVDIRGSITTFAGTGTSSTTFGTASPSAISFYQPSFIVGDTAGNLYMSDQYYVWKYTAATNIFSVIAGTAGSGNTGDGGPISSATFINPNGLWLTTSNVLFVVDKNGHRIRKADFSTNIISHFAGDSAGALGYSTPDSIPASSSLLNSPTGIYVDTNGIMYIADTNNNRIRKVDVNGIMTTFAGTSISGAGGDGGFASYAILASPRDVRGDSLGNIYICDGNPAIRIVNTNGIISALVGTYVSESHSVYSSVTMGIFPVFNLLIASSGTLYFSENNLVSKVVSYSSSTSTAPQLYQSIMTSFTSTPGIIGPVSLSSLAKPAGVYIDTTGTFYVCDAGLYVIRKISNVTGIVSSFIGSAGTARQTGTSASISLVSLNFPTYIAGDTNGNLYFSDQYFIWQYIVTTGIVSVLAGKISTGYTIDPGPVSSALLSTPMGLYLTTSGLLYFADRFNHRIRIIDISTGIIALIGGTGTTTGSLGDGGQATSAVINKPTSVYVDTTGVVFIADNGNNRIRKITPDGIISTIAGTGLAGIGIDGGPATLTHISNPMDLKGDSSGNIYIVESAIIRKISSSGIITTILGNGNSRQMYMNLLPATAGIFSLNGVQIDTMGTIYYNSGVNLRRTISYSPPDPMTKYRLTILSGSRSSSYRDLIPAVSGQLSSVKGLFKDTNGNLYIAEVGNRRFRVINATTGMIRTFAGTGTSSSAGTSGIPSQISLSNPTGIVGDSFGNLYLSDNTYIWQYNISTGIVSVICGSASAGYNGDGSSAGSTLINSVIGLWLTTTNILYFADSFNNRIRFIDLSTMIVDTYAGDGTPASTGDDGLAILASLNRPNFFYLDSNGVMFIADRNNHKIRKIDNSGIITTFAGLGIAGYAGDGVPATLAYLNAPNDVKGDTLGNIYIADGSNHMIRMVSSGIISAFLGNTAGSPPVTGDIQYPYTFIQSPQFILIDAKGSLIISGTTSVYQVDITSARTYQPSPLPTGQPSRQPSGQPTLLPRGRPTSQPTRQPSSQPSRQPSSQPSRQPSSQPSGQPSSQPRSQPSSQPNSQPSCQPSSQPSRQPSCQPSCLPSSQPSIQPNSQPSYQPSSQPTGQPYSVPTTEPFSQPTCQPTSQPSFAPSSKPSLQPISVPSSQPSGNPTRTSSSEPISQPTRIPISPPSGQPSIVPTTLPSSLPTTRPTSGPTGVPSTQPTSIPSNCPSTEPTSVPSGLPSICPISCPSSMPTPTPSSKPGSVPSSNPSGHPSSHPISFPSTVPTILPSIRSISNPTTSPSSQPSMVPSTIPSCLSSIRTSMSPIPSSSSYPCQSSVHPTNRPSRSPVTSTSHPQPSSITTSPPSVISNRSILPSSIPSSFPSHLPTFSPQLSTRPSLLNPETMKPSVLPSSQSSATPTTFLSTQFPSNRDQFTNKPTRPSPDPSLIPTTFLPTLQLNGTQTSAPSLIPSHFLSSRPTDSSSGQRSENGTTCSPSGSRPSSTPTLLPSSGSSPPSMTIPPLCTPTAIPTHSITNGNISSRAPSITAGPSKEPTMLPTYLPSIFPTTTFPTLYPTTIQPTTTSLPSRAPTKQPTRSPSIRPSNSPVMPTSSISIQSENGEERIQGILFLLGRTNSGSSVDRSKLGLTSPLPNQQSYLLFGQKDGKKLPIDLLLGSANVIGSSIEISSHLYQDTISRSSTMIGDINGDGLIDLAIGYPLEDRCEIFYGTATGWKNNVLMSFEVVGVYGSEFGWAIADLGDINSDGWNDFIISAKRIGILYVIYGKSFQKESLNVQSGISSRDGFRIIGSSSDYANLGIALSKGMDFNGDGQLDILFTSITINGEGILHILFGAGNSFSSEDIYLNNSLSSLTLTIQFPLFAFTGLSLSALGDFNSDGFDDIAVSSLPYQGGYLSQQTFLFYGSNSSKRGMINLSDLLEGEDYVIIKGRGFLVQGVGDVNDDTIPDLLIVNYPPVGWQGDSNNAYLLSWLRNISSSPPTISPTRRPTSQPTSQPSFNPSYSQYPSNLPSFQHPTLTARPTRTAKPIVSHRPTIRPSTSKPSTAPTKRPSVLPTIYPTLRKLPTQSPTTAIPSTSTPTRSPTHLLTQRPSIIPTLFPSNLTWQLVDCDQSDKNGTCQYPQDDGNYLIRIDPSPTDVMTKGQQNVYRVNDDGVRRGNKGHRIYQIFPAKNFIILLESFQISSDLIDLTHFSLLWSLEDISFSSYPLTLILARDQLVILPEFETMDQLSSHSFVFSSDHSSLSSSSSSFVNIAASDVGLVSAIALVLLVCFLSISRQVGQNSDEKEEEEKKRAKKKKKKSNNDRGLSVDINSQSSSSSFDPSHSLEPVAKQLVDSPADLERNQPPASSSSSFEASSSHSSQESFQSFDSDSNSFASFATSVLKSSSSSASSSASSTADDEVFSDATV